MNKAILSRTGILLGRLIRTQDISVWMLARWPLNPFVINWRTLWWQSSHLCLPSNQTIRFRVPLPTVFILLNLLKIRKQAKILMQGMDHWKIYNKELSPILKKRSVNNLFEILWHYFCSWAVVKFIESFVAFKSEKKLRLFPHRWFVCSTRRLWLLLLMMVLMVMAMVIRGFAVSLGKWSFPLSLVTPAGRICEK